jgi:hypothetical protein
LIDQFGADGFNIIAFPCNQFRLQEPASNFEIDMYRGDPLTPPQPYAFMAKMTVNDEPILCTPGGDDGSCNRGFPRCDDPNPANCMPTSTRCCMANNVVYDYLLGELPGDIDWNFVSRLLSCASSSACCLACRHRPRARVSASAPSDHAPAVLKRRPSS